MNLHTVFQSHFDFARAKMLHVTFPPSDLSHDTNVVSCESGRTLWKEEVCGIIVRESIIAIDKLRVSVQVEY